MHIFASSQIRFYASVITLVLLGLVASCYSLLLVVTSSSSYSNNNYAGVLYGSLFIVLLDACICTKIGLKARKLSKMWIHGRRYALPEMKSLVSSRIESSRMIRFDQFDLFLPLDQHAIIFPTTNKNSESKGKNHALIFCPGALVEHDAYANLASKLSDRGVVVVVLNFEPLRFVHKLYGYTNQFVRRIMRKVELLQSVKYTWSIGGHSMGAKTATDFIRDMDDFESIVLMGMYHLFGNDLSQNKTKMLVITASNDGFYFRTQSRSEFESKLPKDHEFLEIRGGNHR